MKMVLALMALCIPMLAVAQKGELLSLDQFFTRYSEMEKYTFKELDKEKLKNFADAEELNPKVKEILRKCNFIRMLESKSGESLEKSPGKNLVSVASSVAGVSSRNRSNRSHGNIVFIDGVRVRGGLISLSMEFYHETDISKFNKIQIISIVPNIELYQKKNRIFGIKEFLIISPGRIIHLKGKLDLSSKDEVNKILGISF